MNAYKHSWMPTCICLNTYSDPSLKQYKTKGAAVRFSESSGGLLESCLLQHNDIAVAVNDRVRCAVYSSLFQHNQKSAFYACEDIQKEAQVEIVDNTICKNSVLDFNRYACM